MKKILFLVPILIVFLFYIAVWAAGEMYLGGSYDGFAMGQKNNTPLYGITINPGLPLLLLGE